MRLALVALFALSCKGSQPVSCAELAPDACAAEPACAAIEGYAFGEQGGEPCSPDLLVVPREPVGCQPVERSCPAVEIVGITPDGGFWLLPGGCLPDGWTSSTDPWGYCESTCGSRDPDACLDADTCMVLEGRPLGSDGGSPCLDATVDPEPVGCSEVIACDDAETWAIQPGGQVWWFPDGCVPTGWTVDGGPYPTCP
ncbi:MAG: hypothetical protein H6736_20000 [Alphaproteobacteria bacterium]|nr:hypothetical protein [Alphaproteobacteria bacterium]